MDSWGAEAGDWDGPGARHPVRCWPAPRCTAKSGNLHLNGTRNHCAGQWRVESTFAHLKPLVFISKI